MPTNAIDMPDLHNQLPAVEIPVKSVGHLGVKRMVHVLEHGSPAMVELNVSVGLRPTQRGAHMSRLIECIDGPARPESIRQWLDEVFGRLQAVTPDAASWSLEVKATTVLSVDGGFKPIDEICRLERIAGAEPVRTWGAGFKVCLACPQAQAAIAHDRDDDEHIGVHPSHNQVCDLLITVTGDQRSAAGQTVQSLLALGEGATSGPVRELYKRRGEADVVTLVHHNARFAEDALREITDKLRAECPEADQVTSEIINYESIFEYPLRCVVSG